MISASASGSFSETERFLGQLVGGGIFSTLDYYGAAGVNALQAATPVDTGETAASWSYKVVRKNGAYSIEWHNSNVVDGVPIAIILQYGHGTGTGGYVQGRDYINPALEPIFKKIADNVWKAVRNA